MRALWLDRPNCSHICIFQTCLALKRAFQPGTKYVFKSISEGKGACPWHGPSAPPARHFAIRTLGYKRAFGAGTRYASLGLFFGHSWGNGEGPGWHLVRYLCETRKALHERHVWKTLIIACLKKLNVSGASLIQGDFEGRV